jgi:hypothetical protein
MNVLPNPTNLITDPPSHSTSVSNLLHGRHKQISIYIYQALQIPKNGT